MQGNLQQRGPSSWRIRVFVRCDEAGKKRYLERTVRGTKREAQRVMARLVTEVDEGRHVAAASTRFGEVLDRWLEIKATVVEPTTLASYRWIANTYVAPALGSLPLDKIRALDLDRLYARLRAGGSGTGGELSHRTVRLCHSVVSQTLDQASLDRARRRPPQPTPSPVDPSRSRQVAAAGTRDALTVSTSQRWRIGPGGGDRAP